MSSLIQGFQPKTYRVTIIGPGGTGKREAVRAIHNHVPRELREEFDPFEIDGTGLINQVVYMAGLYPDEPVADKVRLITTTGRIKSSTPMNRLCDRTDGILFFASDSLEENDRVWNLLKAAFLAKNRSIVYTPTVFVVNVKDQNDPDLEEWIATRTGDTIAVDPENDREWALKSMRILLDELLIARGNDGQQLYGDEYLPPEDVVERKNRQGLLGRLFKKKAAAELNDE